MDNPTEQQPQPAEPNPPRLRRAWVLPAAVGGALVIGVVTAAAVTAGPIADRFDRPESDVAGLDTLFEPVAYGAEPFEGQEGRPEFRAEGGADRPLHGPRGHRDPLRLRDGQKIVVGSVASVNDGNLVVRKDDGAEVTVPTDDDTRVGGAQNNELADLGSGERVVVRVGSDGTADRVLAVRAHAAGTVTELDGDRATVVGPDGISVELDLSDVEERPAVGTTVVAVGSATEDGATLKVAEIRELPTVN